METDVGLTHILNNIVGQHSLLDNAIIFLAEYFPYLVAVLFAVFVISRVLPQREKWLLLVQGFGAALLTRAIVEIIRLFVERPRPFVDYPSLVELLPEHSFSFPSGHAAFFFALSTAVFLHNRRWGWWFFAASVAIGLARIAAGVHYPTDILGGAVLGVLVGYFVHRLFMRRVQPPLLSPP